MTTKELIELLQSLDPFGDMRIFIDGDFNSCLLDQKETKIDIVDGDILIH